MYYIQALLIQFQPRVIRTKRTPIIFLGLPEYTGMRLCPVANILPIASLHNQFVFTMNFEYIKARKFNIRHTQY